MIHIHGCWLANGSGRAARAERRASLEEQKRKRREELIEMIAEKYRNRGAESPPWWVLAN